MNVTLYVPVCASPPHPRHPADSESEPSLSGFLTVAGQSFDEDVEHKPVRHSTAAATGRPKGHARMSNGGNHGGEKEHCNGVKRHR